MRLKTTRSAPVVAIGGRPKNHCQTPGAVMTLETVRDVMYCASDGRSKPMSLSTLYKIEQSAMAKIRDHFSRAGYNN